MIRLNNLNKYFNRKKRNEIHVINDVSLTLPQTGLVVLLGPSGSGKTTLLNVLGGLDKLQGGSIEFNGEEIKRYSSKTWDRIRNKDIGYIFQNYNLLNNLTVYDNISLTLHMVGVVDKEEVDKRIDYILDNIGMINYRKRRASQLSGGQQQRVAIARALAKNPKVIIADEPTGNLDSKNTFEIMNIIKKISKNKLVVLVTHEEELADFYADRVIRINDGKVIEDYNNKTSGDLDLKHDTDIYLKDLNMVTDTSSDQSSFKVYSDEEFNKDLNVRLIIKNKTIYVDVKSDDLNKIKLIDKESEVKIYDKHFESVSKDTYEESEFDLDNIVSEEKTVNKHSVISTKYSLKIAFRRMLNMSKIGKLFYLGFAAGAVLIAIAVGMLSNVYKTDSDDFLTSSKDFVSIKVKNNEYEDIMKHEEEASINYVNLLKETSVRLLLPKVFQSSNSIFEVYKTPVISDYMDNSKIIYGREVRDYNEIVLSKVAADDILNYSNVQYLGITNYEDLSRAKVVLNLKGLDDNYKYEINIVGIVDDGNNVVYAKEETIYMMATGYGVYEVFENQVSVSGTLEKDTYMVVNDDRLLEPLDINNTMFLNYLITAGITFDVTSGNVPDMLMPLEMHKEYYFKSYYSFQNEDIYFHSNDIDKTLEYFEGNEIEATSLYNKQLEQYKSRRINEGLATITFTLVVLGASSISYFFIIRSSLLSRIYEVSVYRALGVTKGDIRKIFLIEILLITSLTSLLGYLVTTAILYRIQSIAEDYLEIIHVSFLSVIGGILLIYLVNILSGILPVSNLLRKTPAEILSKYDF